MFEQIKRNLSVRRNVVESAFKIRSQLSLGREITLNGKTVPKQVLPQQDLLKPYARYFYMPMTAPPQELVNTIKSGPLPSELALPFERLNDLLKPGYLPSEVGYSALPDGTKYASSIAKMPNVTTDMLNWWFVWHRLDELRYKIWDPKAHYNVHTSLEDRQQLVNQAIPLHRRIWGTASTYLENFGPGPIELEFEFCSPEQLGFDMWNFFAGAETAFCANADVKGVHLVRKLPEGGVEVRSRFWFPADVPIGVMRDLSFHTLEEYTHLGAILPDLYAEFGPAVG